MKRLVLAGAGHSHARVLLEFARRAVPGLEIVLISPFALAPYSGMIPGWMAGYYRWQDCCIDFARLCHRANATFIADTVVALDPDRCVLALAGGGRIGYDRLSIDIGSTMNAPSGDGIAVLPLRPLGNLHQLWKNIQEKIRALDADARCRIVVVGGGAAGVESIMAARQRLMRLAPHVRFHYTLASAAQDILPGMADGAARRLKRHLIERGIEVASGFAARDIRRGAIFSADGRTLHADIVFWATGAEAHSWPRDSGISSDERGFIRVDSSLRSLSHQAIFAAGDCIRWEPPLPKSGVYAVRMGPVLAENLLASLTGRQLRHYIPQRRSLVLIGTGDARAVAAWGAFSWEGAWVWRWKQFIDRRFVKRYREQC